MSLRITSRLQNEGQRATRASLLHHGNIQILLVLLSVVSRVAREREMDLNDSKRWSEDVARAVEVYHARGTCLIAHPLLAFLAYTATLLSRCGAADDDEKQQGFNTLARGGANRKVPDFKRGWGGWVGGLRVGVRKLFVNFCSRHSGSRETRCK